MKFLADMGVSPQTVKALRAEKYDATHISEEGLFRMEDSAILQKAFEEERIVLTFDLDFTDLLAITSASLPSVVIFRLRNTVPAFVTSRLLSIVSSCSQDLKSGVLITVEDSRYRLRRLPITLPKRT